MDPDRETEIARLTLMWKKYRAGTDLDYGITQYSLSTLASTQLTCLLPQEAVSEFPKHL